MTGAVPAPSASKGDAVLESHLVEIKQATSTTLNQVRAVKYVSLVVLYRPTGQWYVIPAHEVVRRVADRRRGQHTEIAFECATLSLARLSEFRVDARDLRTCTIEAAEASEQIPALRAEMDRVLEQARRVALESRDRVARLLGGME